MQLETDVLMGNKDLGVESDAAKGSVPKFEDHCVQAAKAIQIDEDKEEVHQQNQNT